MNVTGFGSAKRTVTRDGTTAPPDGRERGVMMSTVSAALSKPEIFARLAAHSVSNGHLNGQASRPDGALRMAAR